MMKVAVWAMTLVPLAVSGQNDSTRVFDENHPLVYEDAWDLWPYAFLNENGEPVGYNIDLLKIILNELNIPYTIKLKPTQDALRDLKNGKSDLMLGMDAHFHNEYAKYGETVIQLFTHSIVHKKDVTTGIKRLSDLSRHKVIVHTGSFSHHLMINKGWGNNAIPYNDMQEAVQRAHNDPDYYIVWNTNCLKYLIRKYGFDDLELTPVDIQHGEYKFMSNNPALLHQLDSVFMQLRAKDKLQPIQNKWFYLERTDSGIPSWVWKVAGVLLFVTLAFFTYYLIYRFREKKMTKDLRKTNNRLALLLRTSKVKIWIYHLTSRTTTVLDENGNPYMNYLGYEYAERTNPEDFAKLKEAIKRLSTGQSEKEIVEILAKERALNDEIRNFLMIMTILRRNKDGKPT